MHVELREHIVTNLFPLPLMFVCDSNLPAKSAEEAQKHRQQYEEMVAQVKKRGELIWQISVVLPYSTRVFNCRKSAPLWSLEFTTATNWNL